MQHSKVSNTVATGLAMFSMFFGAGNVVFPLALGQYARDRNSYAVLGLMITAIGVPFMGLIAMTLFDGKYRHFFNRMGQIPGFITAAVIMGLIGPFGALPRCIALAYSTSAAYLSDLSIIGFSVISCLIIFLFTFRRNSIVELLGYILTPFLLISLGIIIVKGYIDSPAAPPSTLEPLTVFLHGLKEGYQTMDLLGAFFFSSVVLICLKQQVETPNEKTPRFLIMLTLKASCIGASLLAIIYIGFSYVAAFNSEALQGVPSDTLINAIAIHILGPYASIVVCIAVSLACLTTAIALASVFAEFIHEDLSRFKLSYISSLLITLVITGFVATLNFTGIVLILAPILQVLYPALITLSLANIFYKLYNFLPVKVPVALTLAVTIGAKAWDFFN